jgi:predicted acetyltransferase
MDIKLISPAIKHKTKIEVYKKGLIDGGSGMDGCGSLYCDDVEIWLEKSNDWRKSNYSSDWNVPYSQFICVRKSDNKIIGMLQIRHTLTDFLLHFGGHIGFDVAIDERRKGYGKAILGLGLEKCKVLGLKRVLVTCKDKNLASRKCIMANGGVYEDTKYWKAEKENIERYWIEIK